MKRCGWPMRGQRREGPCLALLSMVASFLRPDRVSGISWLSCHVLGIYSTIADLNWNEEEGVSPPPSLGRGAALAESPEDAGSSCFLLLGL